MVVSPYIFIVCYSPLYLCWRNRPLIGRMSMPGSMSYFL